MAPCPARFYQHHGIDVYDPRLDPSAALTRRQEVLAAMVAEGYITPSQAAAARASRRRCP
jgi:membrane peptidoglycan carboxypeptidase